jgi:transcription antitermination factor NusG
MQERLRWFASRTRFGQELSIKRSLEQRGVEHFIPTKRTIVVRRGKERPAEVPLIRNLVFLRATKKTALSLANEYSIPLHFIIDRVSKSLLVVPDKQMEDFMRVLDMSKDEGGLVDSPVVPGDKVRVTKGDLAGVEGNVLETRDSTYIVVTLFDFLQAKAHIPRAWLEKI